MMGIEKSFLSSWSGWDEIETGDLQFYTAKLNDETTKLVGENLAALVDSIYISSQNSTVSFYDENGDEILKRNIKIVFA